MDGLDGWTALYFNKKGESVVAYRVDGTSQEPCTSERAAELPMRRIDGGKAVQAFRHLKSSEVSMAWALRSMVQRCPLLWVEPSINSPGAYLDRFHPHLCGECIRSPLDGPVLSCGKICGREGVRKSTVSRTSEPDMRLGNFERFFGSKFWWAARAPTSANEKPRSMTGLTGSGI